MKKLLFIFGVLLLGVITTLVPLLCLTVSIIDFDDPDEVKAEKIHAYIISNYEAKEDWIGDIWQHPIITTIRGAGDCEDLSLLEWMLFRLSGVEASLVFGKLNDRGHAWVEWEDRIWDGIGLKLSSPGQESELPTVVIYKPTLYIPPR